MSETPATPASTPATPPAAAAPSAGAPPLDAPATAVPAPISEKPPEKEKKKKPITFKKPGIVGAVSEALSSPKWRARFWAVAFLVSIVGVMWMTTKAIQIWSHYRAEQAKVKKAVTPEEIAARAEQEKKRLGEEYKKRNLNLGVFQFQMKPTIGDLPPHDIQNIAQIEISVLCDSLTTCDWISAHMQTVKDQITSALVGFSRKDLMSSPGKQSVQEKVLIKVNVSLPDGRIERVFFTKMILS